MSLSIKSNNQPVAENVAKIISKLDLKQRAVAKKSWIRSTGIQ
nr:MAG TPA: hypothetical protein [Caudoviricetes sp.]